MVTPTISYVSFFSKSLGILDTEGNNNNNNNNYYYYYCKYYYYIYM